MHFRQNEVIERRQYIKKVIARTLKCDSMRGYTTE